MPFHDYAVGSLVPPVFEAYARVFHPAWSAGSREPTLTWAEVAAWSGRTMHPLAQWEALARPVVPGEPPFVQQPDGAGLPPLQLASLVELLAAHTTTPDDCFIGVWEGLGWDVESWSPTILPLEERAYCVRRGPLDLALDIDSAAGTRLGRRIMQPPSLLWPADRAWFVASDTDLDSTYLGGSGALVGAVVASDRLEAWPIAADASITIDSDRVNG